MVVFVKSLAHYKAKTFKDVRSEESLKVLLLSKNYSNSMTYYNVLDSQAKSNFRNYLATAFEQLEYKYVPVVITDGFRDANLQMIRMTETKNLDYYLSKVNKGKKSWNYIRLINTLYKSSMSKEEMIKFLETNDTDLTQHQYITSRGTGCEDLVV